MRPRKYNIHLRCMLHAPLPVPLPFTSVTIGGMSSAPKVVVHDGRSKAPQRGSWGKRGGLLVRGLRLVHRFALVRTPSEKWEASLCRSHDRSWPVIHPVLTSVMTSPNSVTHPSWFSIAPVWVNWNQTRGKHSHAKLSLYQAILPLAFSLPLIPRRW